MSSRPKKRSKPAIELVPIKSNAPQALLAKLSKDGLAQCAIGWINQSIKQNNQQQEEEEDEDELTQAQLLQDYSDMRDAKAVTKAELSQRIQADWSGGLTHTQLAQMDVLSLKEKPSSRSWTAYQLMHDTPGPVYASPKQFTNNIGTLLADYHALHIHLDPSADSSLLRLQLIPPPPATLPPSIMLIHLTATPFILLPSSISPSLQPILLQSICSGLSTPPARECKQLQLSGKDWLGLSKLFREQMASGGMAKWTAGRGEGGGPFVPKGRRRKVDDSRGADYVKKEEEKDIVEDEEEPRRERQAEAGVVLGREELPTLEKVDYEVSLAYPTPNETADNDEPPPPFLIRFEGSHVLNGLRYAVDNGFADSGLPSWIGEVAKEGRNVLQVDENGPRR